MDSDQFDDESLTPEIEAPRRPRHFSDLLGLYTPLSVDVRGADAFHAAVRFFELLQNEIKDPEWQRKLVQAWISAVKNRNYARFGKEFRRWKRSLSNPETPTSNHSGDK